MTARTKCVVVPVSVVSRSCDVVDRDDVDVDCERYGYDVDESDAVRR